MENLLIRKATKEDADAIAPLLYLAMEDIVAQLIDDTNADNGIAFLSHFLKLKDNQYSWQNCWLIASDDVVLAAINIYDGAHLEVLRNPILNYLQSHTDQKINPENETQQGEFYIDSLGVSPIAQGQGLGKRLLEFVIEEFVNKQQKTLGLLVDFENPRAKVLYEKLGFILVGEKQLLGHQLYHLQLKPSV